MLHSYDTISTISERMKQLDIINFLDPHFVRDVYYENNFKFSVADLFDGMNKMKSLNLPITKQTLDSYMKEHIKDYLL